MPGKGKGKGRGKGRAQARAPEGLHPPGATRQTVLTEFAAVKKQTVNSGPAGHKKQIVDTQPLKVEERIVETHYPGATIHQPAKDTVQNLSDGNVPEAVRNARFVELDDVPAFQNICEGMDAEGQYRLPTLIGNWTAGFGSVKCHPLTERYLIALLLTERCCEARIGKACPISEALLPRTAAYIVSKVFYVPIEERIGKRKHLKREEELAQNACIYHRLPKLLYYPAPWGEEDVKIWREMAHIGMSTQYA